MTIQVTCPHCDAKNAVPVDKINEDAKCGACSQSIFSGAPIHGTQENLMEIINADVPVVVDFWATWCGPCQNFAPIFKSVAGKKAGTVRFVKVDTDEQQALAMQFQIRSIPSIMVFKGGKRLDFVAGGMSESQFEAWLDAAVEK